MVVIYRLDCITSHSIKVRYFFLFPGVAWASMSKCVLCTEGDVPDEQPSVSLRKKGCEGIKRASEERGDDIDVFPGLKVHIECRRRYCNPGNIATAAKKRALESDDQDDSCRSLRSKEPKFDYKKHCLFCGKGASGSKKADAEVLIPVRSEQFDVSILDQCEKRTDSWSSMVKDRVIFAQDYMLLMPSTISPVV